MMTTITLPDSLAERLARAAAKQNLSLVEYLEDVVPKPEDEKAEQLTYHQEDISKNPLLRLALLAQEHGFIAPEDDISERSRDILGSEFPDDLLKRMNQDADSE